MGYVHRGKVRESEASVAVKVLRPDLTADPVVIARFMQERNILVGLRSPHLVQVQDLVVEGQTLAIVMDLVEGTDTRRYLQERKTLSQAEAVRLVRQTLEGLAVVHAAGVIHRDVKPENVLLDMTGSQPMAKLSDFGVSRVSEGATLTRMTGLIGTPEYMAPELSDGVEATESSDLYSTGILLYELVAGRTPFAGGHPMAVLRRHLEQMPPTIPGVNADLGKVIDRLLAKDPTQRPASAEATIEELDRIAPQLASAAPLPAMPTVQSTPPTDEDALTRFSSPDRVRHEDPQDSATRLSVPRPTSSMASRDRRPSGGPKRRRGLLVALPAAIVVVAVGVVVGAVLGNKHTPPAPTAADYSFSPQVLPDGLAVSRVWHVAGSSGDQFAETLSLTNTTAKQVHTTYDEVIPKSVVANVKDVSFSPSPTKVISADPIVRFDVLVAPGQTFSVKYRTVTSAGDVSQKRLASLAQSYAAAVAAYSSATGHQSAPTLARIRVAPTHATMTIGGKKRLSVTGTMSNGKRAPRVVLQGVTWSSSDTSVAVVSKTGIVTARGKGTAAITVQAGSSVISIPITVKAKPVAIAAGPASGATPSPKPDPKPTARPKPTTKVTQKPTPKPDPKPTTKPTPKKTTPPPVRTQVLAYDNYGNNGPAGHPMCRGNSAVGSSTPGGVAIQTFTVPSGVGVISQAKVWIDPDGTVTAHSALLVNGAQVATSDAAAAGDTWFNYGNIGVRAGDTVQLKIWFTATYGKIITIYTLGNPGGNFQYSNPCSAVNSSGTIYGAGLKATIYGWNF